MKKILWLALFLSFLFTTNLFAASNSDPRFYGSYCGEKTISKAWGLIKIHIKNIEVKAEYIETTTGGLVHGRGSAVVDGTEVHISFAGAVVDHGKLRGSVTITGLGTMSGWAILDNEGLSITISGRGESITLNKNKCANTPPNVNITQFPTAPIKYGRIHHFKGEVQDNQDLTFAPTRLEWKFDETGKLQKSASGLSASTRRPYPTSGQNSNGQGGTIVGVFDPDIYQYTPYLPPGNHTITFSATDSGGLTSEASVNVTVINRPPDSPIILLPVNGDTITAGCDISFLGQTYDQEDGRFLTGHNLVWSSSLDGLIGFGADMRHSLDTIGIHEIALTATDSAGDSSRNLGRHIVHVVQPGVAAERMRGCRPIARIVTPPYHKQKVPMIVSVGQKVMFVGTAEDHEDSLSELNVSWKIERKTLIVLGEEVLDIGNGTDTILEDIQFSQQGLYEITFTVTDTDGHTAQDKMEIRALGVHSQ